MGTMPENGRPQGQNDRYHTDGIGASLIQLVSAFVETIARKMSTGPDRQSHIEIKRADNTPGTTRAGRAEMPQETWNGIGMRKSIAGHINNGLWKLERARRMSSVGQQTSNAFKTISLTKHAIRKFPRNGKHMVQSYSRVLRDAKRRIGVLYTEIRHTERHLRSYNPRSLDAEVSNLEYRLSNTEHTSRRAELEMILEARRDLLASVLMLEDKLARLCAQLGSITSALEVNHIRVVALAGRAAGFSEGDQLARRMQDASEQLALLEQSLRELDEA